MCSASRCGILHGVRLIVCSKKGPIRSLRQACNCVLPGGAEFCTGVPLLVCWKKEPIRSLRQACKCVLPGGAEFGTGVPLLVCWKRNPSEVRDRPVNMFCHAVRNSARGSVACVLAQESLRQLKQVLNMAPRIINCGAGVPTGFCAKCSPRCSKSLDQGSRRASNRDVNYCHNELRCIS